MLNRIMRGNAKSDKKGRNRTIGSTALSYQTLARTLAPALAPALLSTSSQFIRWNHDRVGKSG